MNADPVFGIALETGNALAHIVVENFRAAAGDGIEARVAQANDGVAQGQIRILGDGEDFRGSEAVQPDLRKAQLDDR